jgi:hypothetical protein
MLKSFLFFFRARIGCLLTFLLFFRRFYLVLGHVVLFLLCLFLGSHTVGLGLGLDALELLVVTALQILELFDLLHALVEELPLLEDLGPFLAETVVLLHLVLAPAG